MTTRRREQPVNTEPPRASRIAAQVADEIQSATLGMDNSRLFYTLNFLTLRGFGIHRTTESYTRRSIVLRDCYTEFPAAYSEGHDAAVLIKETLFFGWD